MLLFSRLSPEREVQEGTSGKLEPEPENQMKTKKLFTHMITTLLLPVFFYLHVVFWLQL